MYPSVGHTTEGGPQDFPSAGECRRNYRERSAGYVIGSLINLCFHFQNLSVTWWKTSITATSTKRTMGPSRKLLALASLGQLFSIVQGENAAIKVSGTPPANASAPLLEAFVSYSIEFSSFPDFAGKSFNLACGKC
jgi:hypothetical protein